MDGYGFAQNWKLHTEVFDNQYEMSRIVRKPDFCLCENKAADQLRGLLLLLVVVVAVVVEIVVVVVVSMYDVIDFKYYTGVK